MIKAEQIPDKVWMAMQSVIGDHVPVATQKEAIAAAINAWPSKEEQTSVHYPDCTDKPGKVIEHRIILPLTESGNE